jgi:hypothetical protein
VLGAFAVLIVCLLVIGDITGGWPPFYARIPGPFIVDSWERSVDEQDLALGHWAGVELPFDSGMASDFMTADIVAGLGDQANVETVAYLFLSPKFDQVDRRLATLEQIAFVIVDERISSQLPASGAYFARDPYAGSYSTPIPRGDLLKFNHVPGISRIYSDGTLTVYDLVGSLGSR